MAGWPVTLSGGVNGVNDAARMKPAISLPLAQSADGLPIGVQLIAAYGREDLLIRVAAQLEDAVPWANRRPPISVGG